MKFKQRIFELRTELDNILGWDDNRFNWKKAHVASVFAKLAYLHIPQYELKNTNRANIIPCVEYRDNLKELKNISIEQILREAEFNDFFVVEKPYAVAVVIKVNNVLFISFRGTQQLYDWLVNLNVSRSRPYGNLDVDIYFHKGFYRAAKTCMYDIYSEIQKRFGNKNIIYVTGHSLGGALAAILHALCSSLKNHLRFRYYNQWDDELITHSCYTFGMPRYGNFHANDHFASPFHIYNQSDIVPSVPPKILGFEDSHIEYCLTEDGKVNNSNLRSSSFTTFIYRLLTKKGARNHDIELYIKRTEKAIKNSLQQ